MQLIFNLSAEVLNIFDHHFDAIPRHAKTLEEYSLQTINSSDKNLFTNCCSLLILFR